ncbi:hypothetical protein Y032_0637g948 [Ancylostoma ceylanicum]|uniref:Uncharacterized protein n=1 Tax=Ancylostoma ceylanicum TaxID=53326 RepID=A0A016WJ75_9BILA|nr:hypothetical protein Y032_0637g948 [Ancylostoma ceylanicum]
MCYRFTSAALPIVSGRSCTLTIVNTYYAVFCIVRIEGRGPPRFSHRRYQQMLDLLVTLIPTMYGKVTGVTKTLFFIGSKCPFWDISNTLPESAHAQRRFGMCY